MTVIGPTNLDVTDLGPNPMTSADVMSNIPAETGEPSDVAFFLRVVAPAYEHSYPPDVLGVAPIAGPHITGLTPASVAVATGVQTVTVHGTGFETDSEVEANGAAQATTFVSATQLTFSFDPAPFAVEGEAIITVRNVDNAESNNFPLTVTPTEVIELATEEQSTSPPAAPGDVPPPEAPPDSGGGVTGGRKPRNGNGGKRQT